MNSCWKTRARTERRGSDLGIFSREMPEVVMLSTFKVGRADCTGWSSIRKGAGGKAEH